MKAWELLSDKSKWTQRTTARDARGNPVVSRDPAAVCWCALGAIIKCHPEPRHVPITAALDVAGRRYGTLSLSIVNDQHGYDAALAVLREADV